MSLTAIFMIVTILAVAIYDVYIIVKAGKFESISAYIIRGSKQYPLLVLMGGLVLGHLFWSMSDFDWMKKEDIIKKCEQYIEVNK